MDKVAKEEPPQLGGTLNPEPSDPATRAAKGLAPKSYKDAVEEDNISDLEPLGYDRTNQTKSFSTHSNESSTKTITTTTFHSENTTQTNGHSTSLSNGDSPAKTNGVKTHIANLYGDGVLEKQYENDEGLKLTSSRPPKGYHTGLQSAKLDKVARKIDFKYGDRLVSGREAGKGWSRSKIRWAPLNIPLQRRLQTLMVLVHVISIAGLLALFFAFCAVPLLWPIVVPYLLYTLLSNASISGELSHRSEFLRRSRIWSLFASYFPARLHRSQELPPTKKYIFGYHPHGIISMGAFAAFATEALGFYQLFPGITNTLLTLDSNFRIPLYRDYALAMGLASVSRESIENILSKGGPNNEGMGRAVTIVIGGARESLDALPNQMKLVLKRRKGFVKLAIRNGADLVPVLGFGENDLYEQFQPDKHPWIHKGQLLAKKFLGFTIPLFHARGVFNYDVGLLPYRRPVNIVVGRPIPIEQNPKPDDEYVAEIHQKYMEELQRLWDAWKNVFAKDRVAEMEIVE